MRGTQTLWLPWPRGAGIVFFGALFFFFVIGICFAERISVRCSRAEGACVVVREGLFSTLSVERFPLETLTGARVFERTSRSMDDDDSKTYGVELLTNNGPVALSSITDDREEERIALAAGIDAFIQSRAGDPFVRTLDGFRPTWVTGAGVLLISFLVLNARGRITIEPVANRLTLQRWRWVGPRRRELPLDAIQSVVLHRYERQSDEEDQSRGIAFTTTHEASILFRLPSSPDAPGFVRELQDAIERARATTFPGTDVAPHGG